MLPLVNHHFTFALIVYCHFQSYAISISIFWTIDWLNNDIADFISLIGTVKREQNKDYR